MNPSPTRIELRIDPGLKALVRLGVVVGAPIAVAPSGRELIGEIDTLCRELVSLHEGRAPASIPGLAAARRLYKSFGIDPTRVRPSSEALLRRVLRGKPFPRISNAVDTGNLCSLRSLLPLGLYDAAAIRGGVTLRRGRPGEGYPGIRKETVNLEGRPALADGEGPFGNPTSDSPRTAVSAATRSLWMVIFAPADLGDERLEEAVGFARGAMERHLRGDAGPVRTSGELIQ